LQPCSDSERIRARESDHLPFIYNTQEIVMAHIQLQEGVPGIRGPMAFRPETAKPMRELAEVLLRSPNTLSPGEREAIATYVSSQNDCYYCQTIHGYAAAQYLDNNCALVDQIKRNYQEAPVSEKLKTLLAIAGKVQQGGKYVTSECPKCRIHGSRNSRHRPHRRSLLHVQPLRRRTCHLGSG
jgi:uncharacterized peroxidase-related enzyme